MSLQWFDSSDEEQATPNHTTNDPGYGEVPLKPLSPGNGQYSPLAIAAAFLSNIFGRPQVLAVLLSYWQTQLVPLGLEDLRSQRQEKQQTTATASTTNPGYGGDDDPNAEYDDEFRTFAQGLQLYPGRLVDIELLLQQNAVPAKTDTGSRPFVLTRLVFATPHGSRALALDDVLLTQGEVYWPENVNAQPLITALASMAARPADFWCHCDQQGMVGHEYYSHFYFADELGRRLYRPSLLILLHASQLLTRVFLDALDEELEDEELGELFPPLCKRMVSLLKEDGSGVTWPPDTDPEDVSRVQRLILCLRLCQLPRDMELFWREFTQLVHEESQLAFQEIYVAEQERTGAYLLPGLVRHPTQAVPGEEIFGRLFQQI